MKIIVVGCGRMGSGLARVLQSRGHGVTVVDKDPAAVERLGPSFQGKRVVGIGFDREVLLRTGVERSDGLAAVTNSDETNVVTARIARQVFHVPKVVTRLYDPHKVEVYRRLGVQVVAPVTWGINRTADLLCYSQLDTVLSIGSGEVEIVEAEIPQLLVGQTVNALTIPGEVHVTAISRKGRTFLPTIQTEFQQGDLAHITLLASSASRLQKLLEIG